LLMVTLSSCKGTFCPHPTHQGLADIQHIASSSCKEAKLIPPPPLTAILQHTPLESLDAPGPGSPLLVPMSPSKKQCAHISDLPRDGPIAAMATKSEEGRRNVPGSALQRRAPVHLRLRLDGVPGSPHPLLMTLASVNMPGSFQGPPCPWQTMSTWATKSHSHCLQCFPPDTNQHHTSHTAPRSSRTHYPPFSSTTHTARAPLDTTGARIFIACSLVQVEDHTGVAIQAELGQQPVHRCLQQRHLPCNLTLKEDFRAVVSDLDGHLYMHTAPDVNRPPIAPPAPLCQATPLHSTNAQAGEGLALIGQENGSQQGPTVQAVIWAVADIHASSSQAMSTLHITG
jgi:hypothetical protein